jgi:DNA ligase 1
MKTKLQRAASLLGRKGGTKGGKSRSEAKSAAARANGAKGGRKREPALLTDDLPADVTGWWVSEKYDGVRAIWTGTKLLSRHGKDLHAPASFTAGLPKNIRLDGELWMGRGTFDKLVSTIQRTGSDWSGVRYMVFDLAEPGTFEHRFDSLRDIDLPEHVVIVSHFPALGNSYLEWFEQDVVSKGGEGCVIRRPMSLYRPGRAGDVIKVKRLVADIERWQG